MREILLRGKKDDGGEWVYGSLHIQNGEYLNNGKYTGDEIRILGRRGECDYVDPETVGQYTGLNDKNDRKIFEGDILKFGAYNVQVFWNDEAFSWKATKCENIYDGYRNFEGKPEEWDDIDLGWIAAEVPITGQMTTEIIGNIYDNPDLIKKPKIARERTSEMKNTNETYKIKEVTENHILFTNGSEMTYDHEQDCCEHNYADFEQLDDLARNATFSGDMKFESAECGFIFGTDRMFFVPCYSEQNGYYSNRVDIYWNGEGVLSVDAEECIY